MYDMFFSLLLSVFNAYTIVISEFPPELIIIIISIIIFPYIQFVFVMGDKLQTQLFLHIFYTSLNIFVVKQVKFNNDYTIWRDVFIWETRNNYNWVRICVLLALAHCVYIRWRSHWTIKAESHVTGQCHCGYLLSLSCIRAFFAQDVSPCDHLRRCHYISFVFLLWCR